MDFNLSKEHLLLQEMCCKFTENEIKPIAEEIDEEERFPMETVKKMARYGMMGIPFPKKYGGQGADVLAYAIAVEEISKACATTGVMLSAHTSLCADPIYQFGTEEQKMKFLVPLCTGEKIGAFGLTEPGAGTDAAMQQTTAVLDGDEYVINGTKTFITNAEVADIYVLITMTDKSKGTKGCSAFIVEKGTPGFTFSTMFKKMGIRGSATAELIFENCRIPKENILGKEGQGFKIALATLDGGRIGVAAQALGIAEGAIEETIKYTKERVQFNRRISQFQNTQFELAEMHAKTEAAKLLVYQVACAKENKQPYTKLASMAKLFAALTAGDVTRGCVQLYGGYGYTREYPVERMMRDAKITEIYEGTNEVQKLIIAKHLGIN